MWVDRLLFALQGDDESCQELSIECPPEPVPRKAPPPEPAPRIAPPHAQPPPRHNINVRECIQLAFALARNQSLQSLQLASYPVDVHIALAEGLMHNTTLKSLTVHGRQNNETVEGFASMLKHNRTLISLSLALQVYSPMSQYYIPMSHNVEVQLFEALKQNNVLKFLDLSCLQDVYENTVVAMGEAFEAQCALQTVKIRVACTERVVTAMANMLSSNTKLRSLTLQTVEQSCAQLNRLVAALATALKQNTSLCLLKITLVRPQAGARWPARWSWLEFAEMLEHNGALQFLELGSTSTPLLVSKALERNREASALWRTMVALARCAGFGFRSLNNSSVRDEVFSFFLPPSSDWKPFVTRSRIGCQGYGQSTEASNATPPRMPPRCIVHDNPEHAASALEEGHEDEETNDEARGELEARLADALRQSEAERAAQESGDVALSADDNLEHTPRAFDKGHEDEEADDKAHDDFEAQLADALRESDAEATKREDADFAQAFLYSKAYARPLSGDDVVVLRLTRRSPHVVTTLLESAVLAGVRERVKEAGCELLPDWASGALLLIPLTSEQAVEAGLRLRPCNIIVLRSDQSKIEQAVAELPNRQRPRIRAEYSTTESAVATHEGVQTRFHAEGAEMGNESQEVAMDDEDERIEIWVENTFVHFPEQKDVSQASAFTESAPCDNTGLVEPRNLAQACEPYEEKEKRKEPPNPRQWRR